jgi:hypothetical protein
MSIFLRLPKNGMLAFGAVTFFGLVFAVAFGLSSRTSDHPETPLAASAVPHQDGSTIAAKKDQQITPSEAVPADASRRVPTSQTIPLAALPDAPPPQVPAGPRSSQQVVAAIQETIAHARAVSLSDPSATNQSAVRDASKPPAQTAAAVTPSASIGTSSRGTIAGASETLYSSLLSVQPGTANSQTSEEIQVPPGAKIPAALAGASQENDFSPAQISIKERIAQEFLEQTQSTAKPDGSDLATWNRLANDADERLRKMIGHDAFNRMSLSASQQALEAQNLPQQP